MGSASQDMLCGRCADTGLWRLATTPVVAVYHDVHLALHGKREERLRLLKVALNEVFQAVIAHCERSEQVSAHG